MSSTATVQERGVARLAALGTPSTKAEEWRYVALRSFGDFTTDDPSDIDAVAAAEERLGDLATKAVVLRDGVPVAGLDTLPGNTVLHTEPDEARLSEWGERVARADLAEAHCFAHLAGTLTLELRCAAEEPVVLINVVTGGESGWRLSIDAHQGAIATVALIHLHLGRARSSCGVEVHGGQGSNLRVDEIELGSPDPDSIGQCFVSREFQLDRDAHVAWNTASSGGALSRHLSWAHLNGPGAEMSLGGVKVARGQRQAHDLVRVFHHQGEATSLQRFRTVVDDEAVASFDGIIHVDPGADGTDAFQNSANIQLSRRARVATRPQLDIYADEVSASHGATVGQPDEEEVRYLTSRGIDAQLAKALIIEGFVQEGIDLFALPEIRALVARELIDPLRNA